MRCVVIKRRTGHVLISSLGLRHQGGYYTPVPTQTSRLDPHDPDQRRRFVNHNGTVYYVTANHLVYETNIGREDSAIFIPTGWVYLGGNYKAVPLTMRKMEKVEWVFV